MGWGTGGRPVEAVLEVKGVQQLVEERFAAGVAIHPIGWPDGVEAAPLLILVGDKDDCFSAARIRRAMQDIPAGPFPIKMEILPGAGHRFEDPRFADPVYLTYAQSPTCLFTGTTLTYSKAAHEAAVERVQAFLEEHLK